MVEPSSWIWYDNFIFFLFLIIFSYSFTISVIISFILNFSLFKINELLSILAISKIPSARFLSLFEFLIIPSKKSLSFASIFMIPLRSNSANAIIDWVGFIISCNATYMNSSFNWCVLINSSFFFSNSVILFCLLRWIFKESAIRLNDSVIIDNSSSSLRCWVLNAVTFWCNFLTLEVALVKANIGLNIFLPR